MSGAPSQLARHQPTPALSDGQLLALGARAWQDQEILVVRLSLVSDPIIRQMVRAIADWKYGACAHG